MRMHWSQIDQMVEAAISKSRGQAIESQPYMLSLQQRAAVTRPSTALLSLIGLQIGFKPIAVLRSSAHSLCPFKCPPYDYEKPRDCGMQSIGSKQKPAEL
eukprot:scaffold51602_cov41-Prasinocladus_malaysianus.AAC.3